MFNLWLLNNSISKSVSSKLMNGREFCSEPEFQIGGGIEDNPNILVFILFQNETICYDPH